MSKILLLSLYDRNAYGQRLMSANLKHHGHQCHMVLLKRYDTNPSLDLRLEVDEYPWQGVNKKGKVFKYASNSFISEKETEILLDLVDEIQPDVIGITVNTPLRAQCNKVTSSLKERFDIPIIWGGYDPTVNQADCQDYCDYVCMGEGDQAILEIAECIDAGRSFDEVSNLAYLRDGKLVLNPKAPLEKDLDNYPWRDDTPHNKYFIEDDRLTRNYTVVNDREPGVYHAMSARGCPYKCSYCCEATMKESYKGEVFLRRRSPENLVNEIVQAKEQFGLTRIQFEDEIFGIDKRWLEVFAPLYKEKVDLPFTAYIYPSRQLREILTLLKSAGIDSCCLALESGSERINRQVFQRVYNRGLFLHAAEVCRELDIQFYTDVITYNPYEEEEDLQHTLDVLAEIPGDFHMCLNKLFILPGTKMAERMERDGVSRENPHKDRLFNYYCRLFWITTFTDHSKKITSVIHKMRVFKQFPWMLNPVMVEYLLNPKFVLRWFKFRFRNLQNRYQRRRIAKRNSGAASGISRREQPDEAAA